MANNTVRYKSPVYEVRIQRFNETPGSMKVDSPQAAETYWREKITVMPWFDPEREQCVSVMLNTRYTATGHSLVSIGTLNESIVHGRDVFRAAVALSAYAILLIHIHPSGDPTPSEADNRLTRRMSEAGSLLQIALLDHVIIGTLGQQRSYFSFKEAGVL